MKITYFYFNHFSSPQAHKQNGNLYRDVHYGLWHLSTNDIYYAEHYAKFQRVPVVRTCLDEKHAE